MVPSSLSRGVLFACVLTVLGCGGGDVTAPVVTFGETTFVILANPVVNTDNTPPLPQPGSSRSNVTVDLDQGPSATTDVNGVAVLAPVPPGTRLLSLTGSGESGDVSVAIADKDLQEVAVAVTSGGANVMTRIIYPFGGEVVEVTPSMSTAEVNAALARSNLIVFFRGGTYTGDLQFSGSNVTLFGEGERGGRVTIVGNVTIGGSNNRIRGARVTGNLSVPASDVRIAFSRVDGAFDLTGSGAILLNNGFCGTVTISGSNPTLIQNAGIDPIPSPSGC